MSVISEESHRETECIDQKPTKWMPPTEAKKYLDNGYMPIYTDKGIELFPIFPEGDYSEKQIKNLKEFSIKEESRNPKDLIEEEQKQPRELPRKERI